MIRQLQQVSEFGSPVQYSGLQQNSSSEELQNVSLEQEVEDLRCKLRVTAFGRYLVQEKEEEIQALRQDRNRYIVFIYLFFEGQGEIDELSDALHIFSDDHLTLEVWFYWIPFYAEPNSRERGITGPNSFTSRRDCSAQCSAFMLLLIARA